MRATCATALLLVAAPLAAQSGAFVVRLGNDTLLVEQYRVTGNTLGGDQVFRAARVTTVRHFTATLDRHGGVVRYELAGRPAATPDARLETLRVTFDADTAVVELGIGDSSRSRRLVIPGGAIPFVNQSYALLELVTRQAGRAGQGRPPYVAQLLSLASLAPVAATLTRGAGDSLAVAIGTDPPLSVRVDSAGNILAVRGTGRTGPFTAERVAAVDIAAVARHFADRPLTERHP